MWRRPDAWWVPRSSKPVRGRFGPWRVRFPSASANPQHGHVLAGYFFYGDVVRYARRRVGPEMAGDVAAEVFVVAWRRVDDLMSADNQLAWLYGVARLTVANTMRSERRRSALQQRAAAVTRPDEAAEPSGRTETLAALSRLAPKDQEVLRLVAWEGLKGKDLAVALGTSEAAARSRLHRARHRFERVLEAERALTTNGEPHD